MGDTQKTTDRKKFFQIIWDNYTSQKWQQRLKKIPLIIFKWQTALIVGAALGFTSCYLYFVVSIKAQFDWKVIAGVFGSVGAFLMALLIMSERIMKLIIDEKQFALIESKINSEKSNKEHVSDRLVKDLSPLLSRKLFQADTIYDVRSQHYAEEKVCIARLYIQFLKRRVIALLDDGKLNRDMKRNKIIVVLDSGTTIAQIFENLGKDAYEYIDKTGKDGHWTTRSDISFFTNSIRGVLCLFKYRDQTSRYSEIPFKCHIFPGKILSPYEAIADADTVKSILSLKREGHYVIFVTTGNYLIYNTNDQVITPIARAGFHPDVKAAGYTIADEVHVIAPLGKVLMNCGKVGKTERIQRTLSAFNDALGYHADASDEADKSYVLVSPDMLKNKNAYADIGADQETLIMNQTLPEWSKKTVLVTTSRESADERRFWFSKHFWKLERELDRGFDPDTRAIDFQNTRPFIVYEPFDGLPLSTKLQPKIEIPHKNLRNKDILSRFFEVSPYQ